MDFCPGSKLIRQPKPEEILCTKCGSDIEIWTDELKAKCPKCGEITYRDARLSCLEWCKYGKDCVGEEAFARFSHNRIAMIKSRLQSALEGECECSFEQVSESKKALVFAEEILVREVGDPFIVIPASIFYPFRIRLTDGEKTSYESDQREKLVLQALFKLGFKKEDIEEIRLLILRPGLAEKKNRNNYRIIHDVYSLTELSFEKAHPGARFSETLLTETGKSLALKIGG